MSVNHTFVWQCVTGRKVLCLSAHNKPDIFHILHIPNTNLCLFYEK